MLPRHALMCALLDIEPAPNDGRLEAARPLLDSSALPTEAR